MHHNVSEHVRNPPCIEHPPYIEHNPPCIEHNPPLLTISCAGTRAHTGTSLSWERRGARITHTHLAMCFVPPLLSQVRKGVHDSILELLEPFKVALQCATDPELQRSELASGSPSTHTLELTVPGAVVAAPCTTRAWNAPHLRLQPPVFASPWLVPLIVDVHPATIHRRSGASDYLR